MQDLSQLPFTEVSARGARLHRVHRDGASWLLSGRDGVAPRLLDLLQREYALRERLDARWAAVPQAMLASGEGAMLVLRDPGGHPLRDLAHSARQPLSVAAFLRLARSAAAAVAGMHAAGLVHRALSPDAILFDAEAGQATLTGFGFAAPVREAPLAGAGRAADEEAALAWDDLSFHYMAPELGARTNQTVDARADLYGLGCIFHELLTGAPPFEGDAPAARIHAHATQVPQPPHGARPELPEQLSLIVLRLLAKAPEQRYSSASALMADLRSCEDLLARDGRIPAFALDAGAALIDLQAAAPLVGREDELRRIQHAYGEVLRGEGARFLWVRGAAGLGKSSLLRAAVGGLPQTPLLAEAKGAASPIGMPFAGLARALTPLLNYVLGEPEAAFAAWRERLQLATGPVAGTVARFLPGLAPVLGLPADAPAPVPADAAPVFERELVLRAMARVVASFARPERPLVLLIDDLQWTDPDTLQVLERLASEHVPASLLVLGSLRPPTEDAPLSASLMNLLGAPQAALLALAPLPPEAARALVAQALQLEAREADALDPLVAWIGQRTGGNPFFIRRLLSRLVGDGQLTYDAARAGWHWQVDRLMANPALRDVQELLSRDLLALPEATRALLRILACLGDRATTDCFAIVSGQPQASVEAALLPAQSSVFLAREGKDWTFAHDHMREAVYRAMPEAERLTLHLAIARCLRGLPDAQRPAFLAATQAHHARTLVTDADERQAFAHLNLEAGRQAKSATAHHAARGFFQGALDLFGDDDRSDAAQETRLLCGESEFMTGDLAAADARLSALQATAGEGVFAADLARLRAALYTTLGRFDDALDVGFDFLRRAGIELPRRPTDAEVDAEYALLRAWLDQHGMEGLRAVPVDTDPLRRATIDTFSDLLPPALYANQNLVDLMQLRLVRLAIAHGHTDASANGYVCMPQVLGMRYGDYASALAFGELALHLVDERGLRRYQARVYHTFATFVVPWTAPARRAREYFERALDIATRVGDHTFALYCGRNQATGMLFAGEFLEDVRQTVERGLQRARDANFQLVVNALLAQRSLLARLQDGEDRAAASDRMPEPVEGAPATLVDLAYWVYRLQLGVVFGDQAEALKARQRAEACQHAGRSFAEYADLPFYGALALLQVKAPDAAQSAALDRHLAALDTWAAGCEDNFGARRLLVQAERARSQGRTAEAADGYAGAVSHARRHGLTQVEALAAERAAGFHAEQGRDIESRAYWRHAITAWQRWGAAAKVRQLQQRHPALDDAGQQPPRTSRLHELDVQAVLRVTHALASDIVPERLVETTLRTALESAGADYGALALLRDGEWIVRARARMVRGQLVVTQAPAAFSAAMLPVQVVQAVARTQQAVQLDEAGEAPGLAHDDYVRRQRPRSLLCVPMMRYARLIGVLYLENSLAPRVFTPAKAELLEVIASQAAFALENTRLYEEVLDQGRQRAEAEERLRTALAELARASRLKAMGELLASIVHEIGQPLSAVDTSARAAARWLDRADPDIVEAKAMVAHVSLSAQRARSIIQGLRAMARKADPQFTALDIGDALAECAPLVRGALGDLGVELALEAADHACPVVGDRVQLQQVAINLLMNGAEAMADLPQDQRRMAMRWSRAADGRVQVQIDDHGTGIAADAMDRLLEPFFTTKAHGMGMGLAICKSIVDAHDGQLAFQPRDGGGTRVTLTLPAAMPDAVATHTEVCPVPLAG